MRLEMPIEQFTPTPLATPWPAVVVTGARGFVGRALIPVLATHSIAAQCWQSNDPIFNLANASTSARAKWVDALRNIDVVVHLAAHVHLLRPAHGVDPFLPTQINRDGTLRLAEAALAAGVKRFVFISTAKVFGEGQHEPYRADSTPNPQDAYALSKYEAEQGLQRMTAGSDMELVIIRPPLVYGPGASANYARLKRLADWPIPLPIKNIHNRRDMIGIDNLIDFIMICIHSREAAGGTWLCSDGKAYSLADVVRTLRRARGIPELLVSAPAAWVTRCAELIFGRTATQRLLGNFELDISATRSQLHWSPPHSMQATMQRDKEPH